ncbi:hypothetical protein MYCTH_2057017 [Thermothelomyces thermophilus ATCC 42464]|uniref:Erythromycin esterase n=1 Tax=Thermothelomyces thermophilus (strain ATCC 42464 / BCRC 31852 / DSM 1799) TaxID=573729 RepID=G2Q9Y8_THET4|nr:uncharacterized protein MYCTH_2057017 [Thermothelomyces thermophilus ATCC 42464]AEO56592.1 hypothetical protein MYCTH_2057017 [Thermothelomyces thermophilus ATCC 42464]
MAPPIERDPAVPLLRAHLTPLPPLSESTAALTDFVSHLLRTSGREEPRIVLIGDASHGTSEFYEARAVLTQHLIERHGFAVVAVEADWPDAEAVDRYVRYRPEPGPGSGPALGASEGKGAETEGETRKAGREPAFLRFPTWMWRNQEVQRFTEWLRRHNLGRDPRAPDAVGFYGLDLYSLRASMRAVVEYLDRVDPAMADAARERYARMSLWAEDPHEYGLEALAAGFQGCEKDVMRVLRDLLARRLEYAAEGPDGDEFHSGEQNARVVKDAEQYYKAMYYGRDESWNLRDRHMFETLVRVLKHRSRDGRPAKAVVWAHNSHLGDARATSMGWSRDELNVGQLCREAGGGLVLSIGCSGNTGTVAAARRWDGDMEVMQVRPGLPGSYEELLHATGIERFALDLRRGHCDDELREALMRKRLERFIGVIYSPRTERQSHYSSAVLPEQFDALLWFDKTRHVGALEVHQPHVPLEYDETWPFGL